MRRLLQLFQTEAPKLLTAIEARSDWLVDHGSTHHVANTVWAFATLKTEAPKKLTSALAHSHWLVENSTPQGVASTAWAFASIGYEAPKFFDALSSHNDMVLFGTVKVKSPRCDESLFRHFSSWALGAGNESKVLLQKVWQNAIELL